MGKWTLSVVAVMLTACVSPQQAEPEILPVFGQEKAIRPEYLVRLNFVVFKDEILQCPNLYAAFQEAVAEWTKYLPIEVAIFIEERQGIQFPFPVPFHTDTISDQLGIVHVRFTNVQGLPYNLPKPVLGFWQWETNELCLDSDFLEVNKPLAFAVALHELGHVFGLPHFVGECDPGAITGSIVVPLPVEANKLIMYPYCGADNKDAKLSDLEINIALENLLDLDNLTRNDCLHLTTR